MAIKVPPNPETALLIGELRELANRLENGSTVLNEKPIIRNIVDRILKAAGIGPVMRAMVVNSKYLK